MITCCRNFAMILWCLQLKSLHQKYLVVVSIIVIVIAIIFHYTCQQIIAKKGCLKNNSFDWLRLSSTAY